MGQVKLSQESSNPSAPSSGWTMFIKSDGLYLENASGTVIGPLVGVQGALINAQTGATYLTTDADNGKVITMNNGSANTLTIHAGAAAGFSICVIQLGVGQTTIAAGGTGAVLNRQTQTKIAGLYGMVSVFVVSNAGTAPQCLLGGDTA